VKIGSESTTFVISHTKLASEHCINITKARLNTIKNVVIEFYLKSNIYIYIFAVFRVSREGNHHMYEKFDEKNYR